MDVGLGWVWFWLDPFLLCLVFSLLQQVAAGVDGVFPQFVAGSGGLPATGSWCDFFLSRIFSLWMNLQTALDSDWTAPRRNMKVTKARAKWELVYLSDGGMDIRPGGRTNVLEPR